MDVVLRRLEQTDSMEELTQLLHRAYKQLADLGFRYVATHQTPDVTAQRAARGECYVAAIGEELVGTVTYYPPDVTGGSPWYDRPDVAHFGQFGVDPSWQGSGIGAKLMDLVECRAAATGAEELALDTSEGATHLLLLYERRGYRFIEHVRWSEVNYRSVIMSKALGHGSG